MRPGIITSSNTRSGASAASFSSAAVPSAALVTAFVALAGLVAPPSATDADAKVRREIRVGTTGVCGTAQFCSAGAAFFTGTLTIGDNAGDVLEFTTGGPIIRSGSGTPEGAVTADVGSLFLRTDGGAGTSLYVKESGTGNTGWIAK